MIPALLLLASVSWAQPKSAPPPLPASAIPGAFEAGGRPFVMVSRAGLNAFGQPVTLLDVLDARKLASGTLAHIDFKLANGHARLDGPLDSDTRGLARPAGVPENADLSHFREGLWFGLAVLPPERKLGLGAKLFDTALALLREQGAHTLTIRATESSKDFYLRRLAGRVRSVDTEMTRDGDVYHEIEVDLRPK